MTKILLRMCKGGTKSLRNYRKLLLYNARKYVYETRIKGIAMTYTASGTGFENKMYINFIKDTPLIGELPPDNTEKLAAEHLEDYAAKLQTMSEAETFVLKEINDCEFEKYYSGTDKIQIKAETKNGKFHGDFEEYYLNGNKRSEGSYRKGRKTGRWKYYDEQGQLTEKEWEGM